MLSRIFLIAWCFNIALASVIHSHAAPIAFDALATNQPFKPKSLKTRSVIQNSCDNHTAQLHRALRHVLFITQEALNVLPARGWSHVEEGTRTLFTETRNQLASPHSGITVQNENPELEKALARTALERLLHEVRPDIPSHHLGWPWGRVTIDCEDTYDLYGKCPPPGWFRGFRMDLAVDSTTNIEELGQNKIIIV